MLFAGCVVCCLLIVLLVMPLGLGLVFVGLLVCFAGVDFPCVYLLCLFRFACDMFGWVVIWCVLCVLCLIVISLLWFGLVVCV